MLDHTICKEIEEVILHTMFAKDVKRKNDYFTAFVLVLEKRKNIAKLEFEEGKRKYVLDVKVTFEICIIELKQLLLPYYKDVAKDL